MTEEQTPQENLPLETPAVAEVPAIETPAPAQGVDVDVLADRVIEKLMSAAQTAAPEAQTQTFGGGGNVIKVLRAQAEDPDHPLYHSAVATLEMMRRQGEEEEWGALGCPIGHPARALFASSPQAFSMRPRHAFTEWQLQEAKKGSAEWNARAKAAAEKEKADEAAKVVRESTPGMPSRSVEVRPGQSGKRRMTHQQFYTEVQNDQSLDDLADAGLIEWLD
jgi:hypothetical protein